MRSIAPLTFAAKLFRCVFPDPVSTAQVSRGIHQPQTERRQRNLRPPLPVGVKARRDVDMQAFLRSWLAGVKLQGSLALSIDVDPYTFL